MNIHTTHAPYPPTRTVLGTADSGTITLIKCYWSCTCTVYSAAGVELMHIDSTKRPPGMNGGPRRTYEDIRNQNNWAGPLTWREVSIEFSDGPPYVVQTTPSSIEFTIDTYRRSLGAADDEQQEQPDEPQPEDGAFRTGEGEPVSAVAVEGVSHGPG